MEKVFISQSDCDAIGFKVCAEIEGRFCDYIEKQPVILAGPVVPAPSNSTLEERWKKWLGGFEAKTVIFCSLGSECVLGKEQFQELVLGVELTGMPFFAALKRPLGVEKIEQALPEGFQEGTGERGVVHGGWVQQPLILAHPSVGCNVTHCGYGSLLEALVTECELVLMPQYGDQIINSRLMSGDLEVVVEVEMGEEDGLFTREGVCKAIRLVMEVDGEVGKKCGSGGKHQRANCESAERIVGKHSSPKNAVFWLSCMERGGINGACAIILPICMETLVRYGQLVGSAMVNAWNRKSSHSPVGPRQRPLQSSPGCPVVRSELKDYNLETCPDLP
ncbi:hypothetical protein ACSBR1_015980 [Camellia fascicularis]